MINNCILMSKILTTIVNIYINHRIWIDMFIVYVTNDVTND